MNNKKHVTLCEMSINVHGQCILLMCKTDSMSGFTGKWRVQWKSLREANINLSFVTCGHGAVRYKIVMLL